MCHIPVDGLTEFVDGLGIALLRRLHDAVLQVILQYDLAGVLKRGLHRGQLDQHLRTVAVLLYHLPYILQVPDGPGHPVQHRPRMLVGVRMAISMTVVMLVVVRMRVGNACGMQRLMRLLGQFVRHGFRRGVLYFLSFYLSSPWHYSTSSASTNTLMV